ncbi:MAG: TraB/GumN family protein [Novosphingobium sp.]
MKLISKCLSGAAGIAMMLSGAPAMADGAAKPAAAAAQKLVAPAGPSRPALWKLSDPDTTIYLFGTVHILPKGITWLEGPVAKALDTSDILITEIPEADMAAMQGTVIKLAMLPKDKSLKTILPAKDYAAMDSALKTYGVPSGAFDRLEPWFVAVTLSTLPLVKEGYGADSGAEALIQARSKEARRPHEGLETVEYQLGIFDSLPQDKQIKYLREVIKGLPKIKGQLNTMVKYWSAGNADKLGQMITADQSDPALMAALLTNRNRNWAGWIKQRLDKPGTVFIAVGAGHLAGKDSVQSMLKKQGYTITRVQ